MCRSLSIGGRRGHEIGAQQRLEIVEKQRVPSRQAIVQRQRPSTGEPLRAREPVTLVGAASAARDSTACARAADRGRNALGEQGRVEAQVAGEQLVAAVAGEHDRHLLARQLRHEIGRHRGRIAERPVVMPDERVDQIDRRRRDAELGVIGLEPLGRQARVRGLVVGRVALEADAERLDRLRHHPAHQADDDRRVEAAAEKRAERHVAHEPPLDGARQPLAHARRRLGARDRPHALPPPG